jgi:SAM-dependent methyltransferase
MNKEIYEKIIKKKEFSQIPKSDVEKAWKIYSKNENLGDDEKVKKTRNLLRKIYSGFGGRKIFLWKDKSKDEILEKHLSTRERFNYYLEIYERLLKKIDKCSVIDLGSGVNGFSYEYFEEIGKEVSYFGVEAVGQLVDLTKEFFESKNFDAKCVHISLFELDKIKKLIEDMKKPRVIFMFKVIDSLESLKRNYTLELLSELKKLKIERFVISFATESWFKRKKFFVKRNWLIDFLRENFEFIDDFNIGGERYLVFE